jgi:cytochrome b561
MGLYNTHEAYGAPSKFFHWVLAFFVLCMLVLGYFMDDLSNPILKGVVYNAHKMTGVIILALVICRLVWVSINPKPQLSLETRWWELWAEHLVHWALYLSLLIMPLSGWIGSSAAGKAPKLWGYTFSLPIAKNASVINAAFWVHNTLFWVFAALICGHIGAAFYHHFIRKDQILKRMLP